MPDMSSEQIRDIAVRCVEGFFNEKTPLSQGLAKEASAYDLNLEQIKRAAEVANTVCQLKLMQLSEDKTVEFPLCKVAEVMQAICVPEEGEGFAKQASVTVETAPATGVEYSASEISEHEKTLHFIKEAAVNERVLEQMQDRAIVLQSELVKVASQVKADPKWLDKLSSIQPENFAEMSILVSGQKMEARDFGGHTMFKEAELKTVKTMAALYKEARELVVEMSRRHEMQKQAEEQTYGLTKQAFLGALANAAGAVLGGGARLAGSAALGTAKAGAKAAGRAVGVVKKGGPAGALMGAAALDSVGHLSSGGMGTNASGTSKDVWKALQG